MHDLNGNVLAEMNAAGDTLREYVWIEHRDTQEADTPTGAAMPLAIIADVSTPTPKRYFVHTDHLDRPVMMTDRTGAAAWQAVYKPFGAVYRLTGAGAAAPTAANDNRFPGQWYQGETGLSWKRLLVTWPARSPVPTTPRVPFHGWPKTRT